MSSNRCLILDFDGVIADSVNECLISSFNAYQAYQKKKERIYIVDDIPADTVKRFKEMRPLIRFGQDFVYIHHSFQQELLITNQKDFDLFLKSNQNLNDIFYQLYYQERTTFFQKNNDLWLMANPLYPGIKDLIKRYPKQDIFIVTTKDTFFADEILKANKIFLHRKNLFQAKGEETKKKIINNILIDNQYMPKKSIFIDDHIDMVMSASETGIRSMIATWGYNSATEHQIAIDNNLELIELSKLPQLLLGIDS